MRKHVKLAAVGLLAQVLPDASAFIAPAPAVWEGDAVARALRPQPLAKAITSVSPTFGTDFAQGGLSSSDVLLVSLLLGASAAAMLKRPKVIGRTTRFHRNHQVIKVPWNFKRAPTAYDHSDPAGEEVVRFYAVNRAANRGPLATGRFGRELHHRRKLRKEKITFASEGWAFWRPKKNDKCASMYTGPESHPDNPYFPEVSEGSFSRFPAAKRAVSGWAAAPLSTSTPVFGAIASAPGKAFAGGAATKSGLSAKKCARGGPRPARRGLVLHAHKKAATSTKNQGSNGGHPRRDDVKPGRGPGSAVKHNAFLVNQWGVRWFNGKNVKLCKDWQLRSARDGIVQHRGPPDRTEVFVAPWEYVKTKCEFESNLIVPKEYEPWMGTHLHTSRNPKIRTIILRKRKEWLMTDKGKEWLAKKEEKKAKQKAINKKWRNRMKIRDAIWSETPGMTQREACKQTRIKIKAMAAERKAGKE